MIRTLLLSPPSWPRTQPQQRPNDREVTRQFQREYPCPSTGKRDGACPGFVKDHINPLCNGGPDSAANMQWQPVKEAKVKDRWERKICPP
jgi:hypothetical protein